MARVGAPSRACPERSRRVQAQRSSAVADGHRNVGSRDKVSVMKREISAGGVVLQQISGVWHVALIEPRREEPQVQDQKPATAKAPLNRRTILTLPKGLEDAGEKPQAAALREVPEETGMLAEPV